MKNIPQMEPLIDEHEVQHMITYLRSGGWLTEFKKTADFENLISAFTNSKACCVVANGTLSLVAALMAAGITHGDEVLVPNLTMIATANSVTLVGAQPILVDVDPATLCMDFEEAKSLINENTRAIALVSLNGRSNNFARWRSFCDQQKLFLLEDAAQSLGSYESKRHLGTFGHIGSFSFSAPKIVTTGQGGALVTDLENYAHKLRKIKDFGRVRGGEDWHDELGFNFKFTDVQAVIGIEQMKKLRDRVAKKQEIGKLYSNLLRDIEEIELLPHQDGGLPWFFDIYTQNRDQLREYLKHSGVGTRPVYPPLNRQKILFAEKNYPVSDRFADRGLWLPSSVNLQEEDVRLVCEGIKEFFTLRR